MQIATGADCAPTLISRHYNLVGVPGEYCIEDTILPTGPVFEGMLYPIVKPSLMSFRRVVDRRTGDVCFKQLFSYPNQTPSLLDEDDEEMPPMTSDF